MSTFTVTNTNNSGAGSLRQAVLNANGIPGSTILINIAGTISLSGTLTIVSSMTIVNNTMGGTVVVSGSNLSIVFNISDDGITVNISDITISNGSSPIPSGVSLIGDSTTVTISNCIFRNNNGGGIYTQGASSLIVNNCMFDANTGVNGGCIEITGGTSATITNSTFQNSTASSEGGAIEIHGATTVVSIDGCIIQNNTAPQGGGIYHWGGSLTVNNTTINGNSTSFSGGGISAVGTGPFKIFNSTISNNSTTGSSGGLFLSGTGQKTIINCTLNGNSGVSNGALSAGGGLISIIGCTISNNTSTNGGACISIQGGSTSIGNTVVAINPINARPDFSISGSLTSLGNNFIGDADGTGTIFTQLGSNDQIGTTANPINPLLLPLDNYGGPTFTMLPQSLPPSPLIDAGSNTIVTTYYTDPQLLNSGTPIDQRGLLRTVNSLVDIGSVESGQVFCFSGESKVLTRNSQTDRIEIIKAKNVISHIHEVFDVTEKKFIPIKYNVVNGPVNRFIKIAKNLFGPDLPNEDFLVTGGHKIVVDGCIMKARDIPNTKKIKVKPQNVFSICTKNQTAILINGIAVMTWSEDDFLKYSKKQNIVWHDNQVTKITNSIEL